MTAEPVVYVCDEAEARDLTEQIKRAAERVWNLLHRAHEQRAWAALGYSTWADYVKAEFDMSRSQSYRLLDQAQVIREITAVLPVSPDGDTGQVTLTEVEARDVKPVLTQVVEQVKQRVEEIRQTVAEQPAQALIEQAVAEEIDRGRALAQDLADRRKRSKPAMQKLVAAIPPDYDPADDEARLLALSEVIRAVEGVAGLTYTAADLAAGAHPTSLYHFAGIRSAIDYLHDFADAVEARS